LVPQELEPHNLGNEALRVVAPRRGSVGLERQVAALHPLSLLSAQWIYDEMKGNLRNGSKL
jgi:hypothetical protein